MAFLRIVESGGPSEPVTGADLMRKVGELIADRLPDIPFDDPYWGALHTLVLASGCHRRAAGGRS